MNIEESVRELLLFHDCVIIPKFGAFVSNYEAASINGESVSQFTPPSKRLIFNNKLNYNDGLLLDYLAQTYSLEFAEASSRLQKYIWDFEQKIKIEGSATFGSIGVFSLNEDGYFSFDRFENEFLLADSFGLGIFEFQPINNRPAIRLKRKTTIQDLSRRAVKSKFVKPVLFALPLIVAAGVMRPYFLDQIQKSSFEFESNVSTSASVLPEQATAKLVEKHIEENSNQRSALAYTEPEYHIIVGSFKDQANAMEFLGKPLFGKLTGELLYTNDLYRISVGKFSSKTVARKKLIEMRVRNRELKDAWVFAKK